RTQLFEYVEILHEQVSPNVYNLVVEVTPRFRVLEVRFEGNQRVKDSRLEREAKIQPNQALDERQVKQDAEALREFYQKAGYNQVDIDYTIDRDRVGGFGTVTFNIREGPKVKIARVRFEGNEN